MVFFFFVIHISIFLSLVCFQFLVYGKSSCINTYVNNFCLQVTWGLRFQATMLGITCLIFYRVWVSFPILQNKPNCPWKWNPMQITLYGDRHAVFPSTCLVEHKIMFRLMQNNFKKVTSATGQLASWLWRIGLIHSVLNLLNCHSKPTIGQFSFSRLSRKQSDCFHQRTTLFYLVWLRPKWTKLPKNKTV